VSETKSSSIKKQLTAYDENGIITECHKRTLIESARSHGFTLLDQNIRKISC